MAKAMVLRAWSELSNGGQYSILHRGGCVSLIPIPEKTPHRRPCFLKPSCILSPCSLRPLSFYMLRYTPLLHNDPRLDKGFYTGYWAPRGRLPKGLGRGDIILFVAGLVEEDYARQANRPSRLAAQGLAGIYFVGGLVVEEIIDTSTTGWRKALQRWPRLAYSPHYWRRGDSPVAVVGEGFMLRPPLRASEPGTLSRPSIEAVELLGRRVAEGLARSRFRRSRVFDASIDHVEYVAERFGSRIAKPRQLVCSSSCLRRKPILSI